MKAYIVRYWCHQGHEYEIDSFSIRKKKPKRGCRKSTILTIAGIAWLIMQTLKKLNAVN